MPTSKELLNNSGGGAPPAKFPSKGTTVGGIIKGKKVSQQTDMETGSDLFWPSGDPKMQIEVTVLTDERDAEIEDDDGSRRIFVKGYMMNAVSDAIQEAGVDDIEVGGTLIVTFSDTKPPSKRGFSPAKLFTANYTPPTGTTGLTGGNVPQSSFGDEEPF